MRSEQKFFFRCMLYSFLTSNTIILLGINAQMAVPITNIYNKTSSEWLGIYDEGAFLTSLCSAVSIISLFVSVLLLVPLMDTKGRKFACVHVKFYISLFSSVFYLMAFFFQSSVCILIAFSIIGLSSPLSMMGETVYFAELCKGKMKGYYAAAVNIIANVVSGTIMMFICKPTILGTDDLWYLAVVLAFLMNIAFYAVALGFKETLPEKTSTVLSVIGSRLSLFKEIVSDYYYKMLFLLVLVVHQIPRWSSYSIEMVFPIQLFERENQSPDQTLTMTLIVFLALAPLHFVGPYLNAKIRKVNFLRLEIVALIFKNLVHIVNLNLGTSSLAYLSVILRSVVSAVGVNQIAFIISAEMFPTKYRVVASQIAFLFSMFLQCLMDIAYPLVADYTDLVLIAFSAALIVNWTVVEFIQRRIGKMTLPEKNERSPLLA